jgi:hypothetical protein
LSQTLGVSVSFFFENMPATLAQKEVPTSAIGSDLLAAWETLELVRAYYTIPGALRHASAKSWRLLRERFRLRPRRHAGRAACDLAHANLSRHAPGKVLGERDGFIGDVEQVAKVPFAEHDDMVDALAANRAYQSFRISILPS